MRSIVDKDLHTTDWHLVILDLFEASNRDIFITKDNKKFIKNCFSVSFGLSFVWLFNKSNPLIGLITSISLAFLTIKIVPTILNYFNKIIAEKSVKGIFSFLGLTYLIVLIVGIIEALI